jgi:cytochrome c peroxidase
MSPFEKRGLVLAASLVSACNLHVFDDAPAAEVIDNPVVSPNTASPNPIHLDASNLFFADLGRNGRTCGTCHHEDQGWTVTPAFAQKTADGDPLFLFDGSDCLPPNVANPSARTNSTQLRDFGNVRIELPLPPQADYGLVGHTDPLGCPDPPSDAGLRLYRRPLPTANSAFLAVVMWDGRETTAGAVRADLARQSDDATRIHAQAAQSLTSDQRNSIVGFETGVFNARRTVGSLDLASGANGGPAFLFEDVLPKFSVGINDPLSRGFSSTVFTIYAALEKGASDDLARSIGRGEVIFNNRVFNITDVPGFNGPADHVSSPFQGTCTTCHNNPNVGNASSPVFLDIGVTAAAASTLNVSHLPTYTFKQTTSGRTVTLTDPGRGLITGQFADLGKTKVPNLRGLTLRAPYFHNGSTATLSDVIDFYEARFGLGLTTQERNDLLAFLGAL